MKQIMNLTRRVNVQVLFTRKYQAMQHQSHQDTHLPPKPFKRAPRYHSLLYRTN